MTGLSHDQTKRFLNLGSDQCLSSQERAALEAHLNECKSCQSYAKALGQLDTAIGRALRAKWAAPYRSPIDMAGRVRKQLRADAEKRIILGVTNVLVKLGSLAVGMALVVGLFTNQRALSHPVYLESGAAANGLVAGLSRFEIRDMNSAVLAPLSLIESDLQDQATTPSSRLRALPY